MKARPCISQSITRATPCSRKGLAQCALLILPWRPSFSRRCTDGNQRWDNGGALLVLISGWLVQTTAFFSQHSPFRHGVHTSECNLLPSYLEWWQKKKKKSNGALGELNPLNSLCLHLTRCAAHHVSCHVVRIIIFSKCVQLKIKLCTYFKPVIQFTLCEKCNMTDYTINRYLTTFQLWRLARKCTKQHPSMLSFVQWSVERLGIKWCQFDAFTDSPWYNLRL